MLPIFAVGGTVSGYASMGSAEDLADKMEIKKSKFAMEALEKVREHGENKFKSEFAKEINKEKCYAENVKWDQDVPKQEKNKIKSSSRGFPLYTDNVKSDLMRLKLENKELKQKIKDCILEEERYNHLQTEFGQLKLKLYKVNLH